MNTRETLDIFLVLFCFYEQELFEWEIILNIHKDGSIFILVIPVWHKQIYFSVVIVKDSSFYNSLLMLAD
jgi:hypothetical protein